MASIVRERVKKNGTISFRIRVSDGYDQNRKQKIKEITFLAKSSTLSEARKEAEKYAFEYEEKFKSGSLVVSDRITFYEFALIWKENWLPAKTPTVQENYYDVLKNRVFPSIGNKRLTAIRAPHIDAILKDEQKKGDAPQTIRMTFTVINSVFRYALKKNYISENPCLRCDDLPPVKMKTGNDIQFFTFEQTQRFLNDALTKEYTSSYREHERTLKATKKKYRVGEYGERHKISLQWRVYFSLAIFGSMRRGEECALTWEDIDLEKGFISIHKAAANTKAGQIIKSPKTEAGIRDIVVPEICLTLLKRLKKEQQTKCLQMGTAWNGHRNSDDDSFDKNRLFIQADGSPVHLSTPGHKFAEIIDMYNASVEDESEKLPKIRLHDLRHTSATLLLSLGTDIETVSRRLGHSRASVTLDIYGHGLPEDDRKAADSLQKKFG